MDVCRRFRYFIIFTEYRKFNTSKNSINAPSKKFVLIILHPNPSIHRLEAGGVELVAGQITIQNRGFGWERAGSGVPCATLASLSQLWADWSVWMLPWVCPVSPGPIHPSWGRYLPATTFNAASCRSLDGGVRVEYDPNKKFWPEGLSSSWMC